MYYYLVEKDGKIDSFGCCNSRKAFLEKKELLEMCGAKVRLVSKEVYDGVKRTIRMKDAWTKNRFFKVVRRDLKCAL